MIKAIQIRSYKADCTMSVFVLMQEEKVLMTSNILELPDRGNQRRISCIPEGVYEVAAHKSAKFGKCFHVLDVPNRDAILIHAGNTTKDTLGCLLPGLKSGPNKVINSKKTLDSLMKLCPSGLSLQIVSNQEGERSVIALPIIVEIIAKLAPSLIEMVNNAIQNKSQKKKIEAIKLLMQDDGLTSDEKVKLIQEII